MGIILIFIKETVLTSSSKAVKCGVEEFVKIQEWGKEERVTTYRVLARGKDVWKLLFL